VNFDLSSEATANYRLPRRGTWVYYFAVPSVNRIKVVSPWLLRRHNL
jgi:hypothetical protein